jgi:hypothetical protein
MDHINAMLKGDFDDVVLRKIGTNWSKAFSDLICFISLERIN